MPKFEVNLAVQGWHRYSIIVEADSEEEAIEDAWVEVDEDPPSGGHFKRYDTDVYARALD